jgi:predicted RNA methylase
MKNLDKFYTKPDVAKQCISFIPNISQYTQIIEPSAGSGAFSLQLNNCIALDISPEHETIQKQDWLSYSHLPINKGKTLIIGNPPFGSRSSLAKQFIKKAISIGADTIAFILPSTFSKLSNQNVFPKEWRLVVEETLVKDSFTFEGKNYSISCSFYVWTKTKGELNLRKKKIPQNQDFIFLTRGDSGADFCINGNSGKVRDLEEITNSKAEHYIKSNIEAGILRERFENMDLVFLSSASGGVSWVGQQEILEGYSKLTIAEG